VVVTSVRVEDGAEAGPRYSVSGDSVRIRILAVDDHPLVRDGIAGLIGVQADMTVIAAVANNHVEQLIIAEGT
jgi:hypothetical protein